MGRHTEPDTLSFIEWLRKKGESLGFIAEPEYALYKDEYFVDLVWKLQEDQAPMITFEIETEDGERVFSNTAKIFGTPSKLVLKPWRHFMIIYKTELSEGHRNSLSNVINQHNILLFEKVFTKEAEKQKLEKELESLAYDISELIKTVIQSQPLGASLPLVLKGLTMGLGEGLVKAPQISISVKPSAPGGIKFTTITETPKGEPTFLDKLKESQKTLKPFTIETPQLKDLAIEGKSFFPKEAKAKLTVIPAPSYRPVRVVVPNTNVIFDDILLRLVKTEGTMDYLSSEDRNLPFVFEFNFDREKKNGNFHFDFEPSHGNAKQAFQFEELVKALNAQKELRIVEPKENMTILGFYLHESLEQLDGWYDSISKLAYIQEKTKHIIPAPTKITQEDFKNIYTLVRVINTGEDRGTFNEISITLDKEGARKLIDAVKKEGKISNMELAQASTFGTLFGENIPLGPSILKLPDMQFAAPLEEVEKSVENIPEEGSIRLPLKPIQNNQVSIKFENWLQKSQSF
jgi:hypothetical protein